MRGEIGRLVIYSSLLEILFDEREMTLSFWRRLLKAWLMNITTVKNLIEIFTHESNFPSFYSTCCQACIGIYQWFELEWYAKVFHIMCHFLRWENFCRVKTSSAIESTTTLALFKSKWSTNETICCNRRRCNCAISKDFT